MPQLVSYSHGLIGGKTVSVLLNHVAYSYTVEPPNKGQVGTLTDVRYLEVILYWGVFAENPLFYIFICCISFILHFMTY